jgi:hypothetical protein
VTGTLSPETENPLPVIARELIVTGKAPDEVSVNCCVAVVFTFTLPKETLATFVLSAAAAAFNVRTATADSPPALAVIVAVCMLVTAETDASKLALEAPAATVTAAGTATAALLLANATVKPPVPAAPVNVTVQESDPAPVKALPTQLNPLSTDGFVMVPVPLRFTTVAGAVSELLVSVN